MMTYIEEPRIFFPSNVQHDESTSEVSCSFLITSRFNFVLGFNFLTVLVGESPCLQGLKWSHLKFAYLSKFLDGAVRNPDLLCIFQERYSKQKLLLTQTSFLLDTRLIQMYAHMKPSTLPLEALDSALRKFHLYSIFVNNSNRLRSENSAH